jgi:hypothetical protein
MRENPVGMNRLGWIEFWGKPGICRLVTIAARAALNTPSKTGPFSRGNHQALALPA